MSLSTARTSTGDPTTEPHPARRLLNGRRGDIILGISGLIGLVVAWGVIEGIWRPGQYVMPSPFQVADALAANIGLILEQGGATLGHFLLGYVLSIAIGAILAVAMSFFASLANIVWPFAVTLYIIPQLAVAPVLILWFGIGLLPKILLIVVVGFFPVMSNTLTGLRSVDRRVWDLARSFGMGRIAYFLKVEAWAALPLFFVGARIALTFSVIATLVAEYFASTQGLGNLVRNATAMFDMALALSIVLVVVLGSATLYLLVTLIEKATTPWVLGRGHGGEA